MVNVEWLTPLSQDLPLLFSLCLFLAPSLGVSLEFIPKRYIYYTYTFKRDTFKSAVCERTDQDTKKNHLLQVAAKLGAHVGQGRLLLGILISLLLGISLFLSQPFFLMEPYISK